MNLETFKTYINNRPFITNNFTDEEISKALQFAELLINTFYDLPEQFKEEKDYETIICEETIYLLQNDPTSEYLTKYEGLSQFNVAGAISATVIEEYLPYISRLVKLFMRKNGFFPVISDNTNITYNYTTF